MRFFALLDFHHLVLGFFLGLAGALIVYLSFRYRATGNPHREGEPIDLPPTSNQTGNNPVPPILVFVYVGVLLSILLYVVFFIMSGKAF
jgi:hypothetical protein